MDEAELVPLVGARRTRRFSCSRAQASVFAISFFSYASMHVGRKAYSAIKPMLSEERVLVSSVPTDQLFGRMDAGFLLLYSAGLFASGALADRHDLRVVLHHGRSGLLGGATAGHHGLLRLHLKA